LNAISTAIPDVEIICQKIDERIGALNELEFVSDVAKAREQLSLHVERIEIATDGQAWLYPTANGLLADVPEAVQGFSGIPRGI